MGEVISALPLMRGCLLVYLDPEFTMIGLAMARSLGDFAVKSVGVIAEPEVKVFEIEDDVDEFLIMASDGVWEFIGSQEAVDIVSQKLSAGELVTALARTNRASDAAMDGRRRRLQR